ncbi:MAG: ComEC/Rec2 family competence protein, partial [Candidatus Omnitrophota bacterium]
MRNKYDMTSLPSGLFSASQVNLWLFILLSCGIILGRLMPILLVYAVASCIACTCAVVNRRDRIRGSVISISIFFVCLGALLYIFSYPVRDVPPLKQVHTYRVKVSSLPLPRHLRNVFFADVSLADHRSARLRVRVMDYTRSMEYLRTYQVEAKLTGNVYQGRPYYTLWVDSRVKPLSEPADAYTALSRSMNLRVLEIFKNTLSDQGYRFLASVFMGRRELLERGEKTIFTDAGIAHLLAISGSNIGLAAVVVFFLLQLFGIKFRPCLAISVVFLACYMVLTGPNPPIVRAVIMYTILAAGFFLKRKVNALNSFGLAGLVCLVFDPGWLFDVSFQLSFLSIGALIIGFKLYAPAPTKYGLFDYVRYIFLSSLWVTVFIAPLVAYYFKRFYILSVFHN